MNFNDKIKHNNNSIMKRFIFFLILFPFAVFAQSPGGVGSPELWFQTVGEGGLLNGNYRWQDFSGDSLRLNVYDSRGAAFGEEYTSSSVRFYNGRPALELDKLSDMSSREVLLKRTNLSQATITGAFAPSAGFDANRLIYGLNGRAGQGVFVGTDKVYSSRESGKEAFNYGETEGMDLSYSANDAEVNANSFRETSFRIATYYRALPPATGLWGEPSQAVLTFNSAASTNINHSSAYNIPLTENRKFSGYIPEIIAYSRLLTPLERRKVESYLAVKYGISLPVSFIGSDGRLVWDCAENEEYNHRITAIYRDDSSGLVQLESATSYEENRYTDLLTNDYFYLANPDNRTSPSRLLAVGREDGNSLSDREYLFWGDNGASTALNGETWLEGLKRMNRQWIVKTNIIPAPQTVSWTVENLEFKENKPFVTVIKAGGSSAATGTAVTTVPLSGKAGYLGVGSYVITGGLTLRFGSQAATYTSGSHDYGYFIDSDFRTYKIEGGVKQTSPFATLILASSIEAEKTGDRLFLRVNGIKLTGSEIIIAGTDIEKAFYGAVSVDRGLTDAGFNLRHGGFTDTGNRIELSYYCAPDFESSSTEKAVLVIDRSGTGDFHDVEYIPASEIDVLRQKIVFHDVFFDRDGNGTDIFTFAYGKAEALGNLVVIPPECGKSNGEFTLNTDWGVRGYNYALKDLQSGITVLSGWEGSLTVHAGDLPVGNYELTVSEAGGYTFETVASSGGLLRAKTTNFLPAIDGNITWRVSGTTGTYSIGYTASTAAVNSSSNIFHYGLKQSGNKIYKIENGNATQLSSVTLQTGDELKIVKGLISIDYYRNGSKIGTSLIRLQDYGLSFYGLIDFGQGPTELLNANAEGFFNLVDYRWNTTEGVTAARASGASKKYSIDMSVCRPQTSQPDAVTLPENGSNVLKLSQIHGTHTLRAELNLEKPESVSLLVFDVKGLPVVRAELTAPQSVQAAELTVPQTGIYIVKALTYSGQEYGSKIIIK
jgi:hypothetical protein